MPGDAAFKSGMKSYLTKYSYQNTLTPQLWAELEAASSFPVTSVMKTWTEQVRGGHDDGDVMVM